VRDKELRGQSEERVGCGTLIGRKNCRSVSIIERGLVILTINTARLGVTTTDPLQNCGNPLQEELLPSYLGPVEQTAPPKPIDRFFPAGPLVLGIPDLEIIYKKQLRGVLYASNYTNRTAVFCRRGVSLGQLSGSSQPLMSIS
jgi:hypothetical protein